MCDLYESIRMGSIKIYKFHKKGEQEKRMISYCLYSVPF